MTRAKVSSHTGLTLLQDGVGGSHLDNQSLRFCACLSRNGRSARNVITWSPQEPSGKSPAVTCPVQSECGRPASVGEGGLSTTSVGWSSSPSPEAAGSAWTGASGHRASSFPLTKNTDGVGRDGRRGPRRVRTPSPRRVFSHRGVQATPARTPNHCSVSGTRATSLYPGSPAAPARVPACITHTWLRPLT